MLFAMLQEQHNTQITSMEATNKANMDAMMECMNALVAAGGANKENIVPPGTTPMTGKKHHCPNCKKMVLHKAADCDKTNALTVGSRPSHRLDRDRGQR